MTTQQHHLSHVADRIAATVLEFCRRHKGRQFTGDELRSYVSLRHIFAPESPGRILRELKKRGDVDYELVSRAASLYRVISVRGDQRFHMAPDGGSER